MRGALKRRFVCLFAGVAVLLGGIWAVPVRALAAPAGSTCSNAYLNSDSRLGPAQLPTGGSLYPMVATYQPLAGLTASQFLATYWNPAANGGMGGWNYPPDNGYLLNAKGQPIEYVLRLGVGQRIDRFGSPFGAFLAPMEMPYQSRALPPMSLDNFDPAFTCNYHLYQVRKSFKVESGPIAPGFGQPGLGRQYQLENSLVPGSPGSLNVNWLLNNGYLTTLPIPADQ
ncbi:MAG: TNT domain-containing protein [Acidimicrobiales bacterium]